MDGTELTLDLMQILELMDTPSNYSKVAAVCATLQGKLRRIRVSAIEMCASSADASPEALRHVEEQAARRAAILQTYSSRLSVSPKSA
jgi:hypothetical protein